jgi:hypothetical protein
MSLHTINTYQDKQGQWRWNISVTPGTPGGTPDDVVADSFFGVYFGTYDDSFLELYQEWNPSDDGQGVPSSVVVNEAPSVEEQAGAETNG